MTSEQLTLENRPTTAPNVHVAHHFESAQQQFDAGKLGMWLFLVTEVLFFSGLFVAYAVYRGNHPEVFVDAHKYLNTTLGTLNTIVLLLSSLTMAWAVRCAQLSQQRGLVLLLATTLACASLFLGVKAVEYSHKWGEGLLWAGAYAGEVAHSADVDQQIFRALIILCLPTMLALLVSAIGLGNSLRGGSKHSMTRKLWGSLVVAAIAYFAGVGIGQAVEHFSSPAYDPEIHLHNNELHAAETTEAETFTGVVFSIYYAMTGVHAIHILAGMGVIVWLLRRSIRGDFGADYFGPVDYVGLYWHLIDLVWIYLYPLLYLIR